MTALAASRRLLHVGVLVGLLILWAILQRTWVPAAATVPLVGAVLFGLLEVLLPLPEGGRRDVQLGPQLLLNDKTTVTVTTDAVPAPLNLRLLERTPEGVSVEKGSQTAFRAAQKGISADYTLVADRRGDHLFETAHVRRTGLLGMFHRGADLPVPTPLTVLPASSKNLDVRVRPRPPTGQGLATKSLKRGPGDEFLALRAYQPGDDVADVNWRATARMNRIITNEYLPDEPPRYLVYVDTRSYATEQGEPDVFERTLELAAVLIEALLESRAQVGLTLVSYHTVFLIPGGGRNQLTRIREMIRRAQPGPDAPLRDLVMASIAHLPARADAILITPNIYDATLEEAVGLLRTRHRRLTVLAPAYPEVGGDDLVSSARRASGALLNAEQAAALAGLKGYADVVAQWPPEEPIAVTLSRLNMTRRSR